MNEKQKLPPKKSSPQAVVDEELLTEQLASSFLHLSVKTLQAWRVAGRGPAFVRLGRRIVYRRSSIMNFIEENTFHSTSEADFSATKTKTQKEGTVRWRS